MTFLKLDDIPQKEIVPGCHMRAIHSDNMTLTYWNLENDADIPDHSHKHEQISSVIEGEIEITVDGETQRISAGRVVVIPSNTRHSVKAMSESYVIDAFYPAREDYR